MLYSIHGNSPSMLSIIFNCEGQMLWWTPNHTSLPLPRRWVSPSGGVKKDLPTGVYLKKTKWRVRDGGS